jgi:hypothetical protein
MTLLFQHFQLAVATRNEHATRNVIATTSKQQPPLKGFVFPGVFDVQFASSRHLLIL